ncbi:AraC family transcriptional regulator [Pandoraea capi]|uniref:helix-turn-helix transcriptional regulator n=1 Tax=Pandoraea TaxID=93217 RepID=UPI001F5CAF54|nr:AraC family transcriptional regulator [Pandoraea capi]MCI3208045.1 AraC family transcriptional regulator [Pandoraea sp. LA3]MDN4586074.1 AraC family transcriptional regulator [Pandoraea capi]
MKPYPTAQRHLCGDRIADVRHVSVGEYRTQPHMHDDEFMFLLPRTGQLVLNVETNVSPVRISPKSFVVVPPRRMHDTRGYRVGQAHVAVYVASDFVSFCERKASRKLSCSRATIWSAPLLLLDAVRVATTQPSPDAAFSSELAIFRADLAAQTLAASCVEAGLTSAPLPADRGDAQVEIVRDIRMFLDSTLDQPVSLDRIAYEFGLSRRTLTRLFRDLTGETVVDYQSRRRVEVAAALLSAPGMTVLSVAAAVGLDSPSYLARLFKKYGYAPPNAFKHVDSGSN